MDVYWEVALPGRLGRMVSWARPGKGAGQCEEEGPWRAAKQPGG